MTQSAMRTAIEGSTQIEQAIEQWRVASAACDAAFHAAVTGCNAAMDAAGITRCTTTPDDKGYARSFYRDETRLRGRRRGRTGEDAASRGGRPVLRARDGLAHHGRGSLPGQAAGHRHRARAGCPAGAPGAGRRRALRGDARVCRHPRRGSERKAVVDYMRQNAAEAKAEAAKLGMAGEAAMKLLAAAIEGLAGFFEDGGHCK